MRKIPIGEIVKARTLSVVIGRFQVPSLTMGHSRLLTTAQKAGEHVLVLIGSPGKPPSVSNPLDYLMREKMIRQALPWATIMPVWDHPDDQQWMRTVEELAESVRMIQRLDSIVYYTDSEGFVKYCMPSNGDVVYESPQKYDERGTSVRQRTGRLIEHSVDFRKGVIWATQNQFPIVSPTVDIACIDPTSKALLLIRKKNEPGWRLPGGFIDVKDESALDAAKRELMEECGADLNVSDWKYWTTRKIHDWRLRGEENRGIMTTVFTCLRMWGNAVPGDDAHEVAWFLKSVHPDVVPEHRTMVDEIRRGI